MMSDRGLLGRFVTLEGGEGSGKSTLLEGLTKRAQALGISSIKTREPGGTPLAEELREIVLNPPKGERWSPMAEALLINAARTDHLEKKIRPALEAGQWVFCDRFSDSTLAYQSIGDGVSMPTLLTMEAMVLEYSRPDITLILDAPPEKLLERRVKRGGAVDTFEERPMRFTEASEMPFWGSQKSGPSGVSF